MTVDALIKALQGLSKADRKCPAVMEMGSIEDIISVEVKELGKWVKDPKTKEEKKVPVRTVVLS